jgi:hypothetical protein
MADTGGRFFLPGAGRVYFGERTGRRTLHEISLPRKAVCISTLHFPDSISSTLHNKYIKSISRSSVGDENEKDWLK